MAPYFGTVRYKITEHRINLRLPTEACERVDRLRKEGQGGLSFNAWVELAIKEKVERDEYVRKSPTAGNEQQEGRTFYEFFAGAGMARLGLGPLWRCLRSNDFDAMKARVYRENWDGAPELLVDDIKKVTTDQLPGNPDLVWASFPCQDVSLAGNSLGIGKFDDQKPTRSGMFWAFWALIKGLRDERRPPTVLVLENVHGVLTSNGGADFCAIATALTSVGYKIGALTLDAKLFLPQSRPRVFIVCVLDSLFVDPTLVSRDALDRLHPGAIQTAFHKLPEEVKKSWVWWFLPEPPARRAKFLDAIEHVPTGVQWHTQKETRDLLGMMSPLNRKKVEAAVKLGSRTVGAIYKRTRIEGGRKVQRAEVRFDDVAGCLRTPAGGSSRQLILLVDRGTVRTRLLSPREAARLMGLPDTFKLPERYNDAYHVAGDGVAVPVVSYLAEHILLPIVDSNRPQSILPLRAA